MDLNGIKEHWQTWAREYGTNLRATTKASTAKTLEVDALARAIKNLYVDNPAISILEMGCGNGQNCFNLQERFPLAKFTGFDFVSEMIESAKSVKAELGISDQKLIFDVANVLSLPADLPQYDLIFTDRCLINLNTTALQIQAIGNLAGLLKAGGHLLMIENSMLTYERQNRARTRVGLTPRKPAEFNHFFEEREIIPALSACKLELLESEDFISLHDLVLYVLVPMTNGGNVDYEHPMVKAATELSLGLSASESSSVGTYGQNRLYKCRKQSN